MSFASANTMNNLVLALDKTQSTVDMALAVQEYALSDNSIERNLQLLYGLSAIKSQNNIYINDVLNFGKGYVKSSITGTNEEFPTNNETGFTIFEVLGNIDTMSDGYVFGKVFLTSDISGLSITFSLARPINNPTGNPLIISKDIDIETAEEIIKNMPSIVIIKFCV